MANFELILFPNDLALAKAVASDWIFEVEAAQRAGAPQFVALSGGRIARQFFSAVDELAQARKVSFAPVHFFGRMNDVFHHRMQKAILPWPTSTCFDLWRFSPIKFTRFLVILTPPKLLRLPLPN